MDVDLKEEGGILPPKGVEGCVRAGVETSVKRLTFLLGKNCFDVLKKILLVKRNGDDA